MNEFTENEITKKNEIAKATNDFPEKQMNSQKTHELLVFGLLEDSKINFTSTCSNDLSKSIKDIMALDNFLEIGARA